MTVTRIALQTAMRAAAVTLLESFKTATSIDLQIYPARPRTLYPPTAFVDSLSEQLVLTGPFLRERTPTVSVVVIHGIFDTADTAAQRDAFVDGFVDWIADNYHAISAETGIGGRIAVNDIPNYVPDWIPPAEQKSYYATQLLVEGYATD